MGECVVNVASRIQPLELRTPEISNRIAVMTGSHDELGATHTRTTHTSTLQTCIHVSVVFVIVAVVIVVVTIVMIVVVVLV